MNPRQSPLLAVALLAACSSALPPDVSGTGNMCTNGTECPSGICVPMGGTSVCTAHCGQTSDCKPGWSCAPLAGQASSVCQCVASPEKCDGLDNDCNGQIDDGTPCGPFAACTAAHCIQCTPTPTVMAKFVANVITLPQDRMTFGMDLNGDGKIDNQLGNIMGALDAVNLNPQLNLQAQVDAGSGLLLLQTAAASFTSDPCSRVILEQAANHPSPDFSGAGSFTVDSTIAPANFTGAFTQSRYSSDAPSTTHFPVALTLSPALFGPTPTALPLFGAHVQFSQGPSGLTAGQINGVIKSSDVQTIVIPSIAAGLNAEVQADPTGPNAMQLLQIFDLDHSGTITTDEVANNSIIKNVLLPDVQMFDAAGHYAPNPDNTTKDSLSVGIGFTAVAATF